jgi:hypothetical protein
MILYHGSNTEIDHIDLSKCRPYRDFGKGFYTTIMKDQAWNMANRTVRMYRTGKPCIMEFSFDDDLLMDLSFAIKRFEDPCDEWAEFVVNNRDHEYKNIESPTCNSDNKYDIVIGPVANDRMTALFDLYLSDGLSQAALTAELTYKKLSNQVSFHTKRIISNVIKTGVFYEYCGL